MKKRVLSKGEVISLIDRTNNKQMKAIMSVMFITGGRISEVLQLKAKDLWRDENYLYIKMIVLKKRGSIIPEITRKIPKNNFFVNHIVNWINEENHFEPDDFLFEYRRQTVWKKLKELEPEIHPHLFRHSLASHMGKRVDMITMRDWFKWSNLNMAQVYIHNKNTINTFADAMDMD